MTLRRSLALLPNFLYAFLLPVAAIAANQQVANSGWFCWATENFVVYTTDSDLCKRLAKHCESERQRLANRWLGESAAQMWHDCRCIVVVHPTAAAYATAVGRGGEQSTGCSTTRTREGKLVYRRIDLRADRGDPLTAALPHELTHVILADKFLDRVLPRWADEGMAILADPEHKQTGHARDAQFAAFGSGRFSARDLLQLTDYPPATRQIAFYGQSAALVKYLVSQKGEQKFLDFVERVIAEDPDEALRSIYSINGAAELERLWSKSESQQLIARQ